MGLASGDIFNSPRNPMVICVASECECILSAIPLGNLTNARVAPVFGSSQSTFCFTSVR
jgi:hypothetical protein